MALPARCARRRDNTGRLLTAVGLLLLGMACHRESVHVPMESDWIDRGIVLDAGEPFGSAWDSIIEGFYPCGLIKKEGIYYLYYGGAQNYITRSDNIGPAHRSIGVATSPDGLHWTRYEGNPVLHYAATGNPEEGSPAAAFALDAGGEVVAFYSAGDSGSLESTNVRYDIRLAVSPDGLTFEDRGQVLDHRDPWVYGHGDELFPIVAYRGDSGWNVYYFANGANKRWENRRLAVARGATREALTETEPVRGRLRVVEVWSAGSRVLVGPEAYLFTVRPDPAVLEVRRHDRDRPARLSRPVTTYRERNRDPVVYFDHERQTWFMYYATWSYVGLRTAPGHVRDATPPEAPGEILAHSRGHRGIELSWSASSDEDTGVAEYRVYREGELIGSTRNRSFLDSGLSERTSYRYEIRAVNLHGAESAPGALVARTSADTDPPEIVSVATGESDRIATVVFDEKLSRASAEETARYEIRPGLVVEAVALAEDARTVTLTTSPQTAGRLYTLKVKGVGDAAFASNAGTAERAYTYSAVAGLVGYWRLDDGVGAIARDTSGSAIDGELAGAPQWTQGRRGGALRLDGLDDHVRLEPASPLKTALRSSFTVVAWVKPTGVPANTNSIDGAYAVFGGSHLGLGYASSRRFYARIRTDEGTFDLESTEFEPDRWHHVALVNDDLSKDLGLYVDGRPTERSPMRYRGRIPPRSNIGETHRRYWSQYWIGSENPKFRSRSHFFSGIIDDVRVYTRALTEAEIRLLHEAGT